MSKRRLAPSAQATPNISPLLPWEDRVVNAVALTIEFWGFKASHGRVWALLYLRGDALTAAELEAVLGLSKGSVSMSARELEQWGVIHRTRTGADDAWRFAAEINLFTMVSRVLQQRELAFIARVEADLEVALAAAKQGQATPAQLDRLRRMQTLASRLRRALEAFIKTAQLDLSGWSSVLGKSSTLAAISATARPLARALGK